jgi:hypothetical protein
MSDANNPATTPAYDGASICKRYDALYAAAATVRDRYQQIAEYIFPNRADFDVIRTPGENRQTKVFDSTGENALQLLAAGLHGMATNPASRWFAVQTTDESLMDVDPVRRYLSVVEDRMFAEMHAPPSSITTHLHELYLDYGAFGTGCMFIGTNRAGGLMFQTRFIGECVIDENAEGIVDTVIRKFRMTVRTAYQRWAEKCSDAVKKLYADGKVDEKVTILHAVFPREEADLEKDDVPNMPFASIYLEEAEKHVLNEGGFEEFPFAVPRWYKVAGEIYGRAPAHSALPDVKMLQEMMRTTLKSAQKIADPPLMVPDDGVIGPVRTVPGGLNFLRGDGEIRPIQTGANVPLSLEMMQDVRDRINRTFFVDQLQMAGDADMTATEVVQRTQERMRLLGPILGRMETELLGPIITRVFGILHRAGKFPQQPQELDGQSWTVRYVSEIALAQRGQKVTRVLSALQTASQIGEAVAAGGAAMARVNTDEIVPWVFREMNADPELLESDEAYAQKQNVGQLLNAVGPAAQAADAFQKAGAGAKALAEAGQTAQGVAA